MKTLFTIVLTSFFILCTNSIMAANGMPEITLKGGTLEPGKKLDIDLAPLNPGSFYKVVCYISASNSANAYFGLDFQGKMDWAILTSLNGQSIPGTLNDGLFVQLQKGQNTFMINEIFQPTAAIPSLKIEIHNLDKYAVLTVANCIAS